MGQMISRQVIQVDFRTKTIIRKETKVESTHKPVNAYPDDVKFYYHKIDGSYEVWAERNGKHGKARYDEERYKVDAKEAAFCALLRAEGI